MSPTTLPSSVRDVRFLLDLVAIYEQAGERVAVAHPELGQKIEELGARFDLAYVKENMEKILRSTRQGVKRVGDIVQNLAGSPRHDRAAVEQADIHEALNSALEMLRGRLDRRDIKVDEHLGELPLVAGSPAQLNQVFLNLLVNAMQAIESTHRPDGKITITTALSDLRGRRRGSPTMAAGYPRTSCPDLRSVFHHQGGRRRNRIGPDHHAWHGPGLWWSSPGGKRSRPGHLHFASFCLWPGAE